MNFLEQLAAEWYEYKGYFVRTNIKFGKRKEGGYEGEMDVVAFDPKKKELIHIECSGDADPWQKRKERFNRKFRSASNFYRQIFEFKIDHIRQIAIVGFSWQKNKSDFGQSIETVSIPGFIQEVNKELRNKDVMKNVIPESYPLLRAIQFSVFYNNKYKNKF